MFVEFGSSIGILDAWAERLFAASWQGGLLLTVAWLISFICKQIPASTRCWLWRIAYFKFILVLFFGCFLKVPILTATKDSLTVKTTAVDNESKRNTVGELAGSNLSLAAPFHLKNGSVSLHSEVNVGSPSRGEGGRTWVVVLFGLWSLGGVSSIVLVLRQHWLAKRLIENGTPFVGREFLGQYRTLCRSMGLVKPPRVATSNDLVSPMLIGIWKPTILLPNIVVETCRQNELKLIVAHELAHFRRRDLFWNWLPAFVRSCFFFHPLVWLTQSRYSLDQEIACDSQALRVTLAREKEYGNLLVKVSSTLPADRSPIPATVGVASSFKTLKQRILEMSRFRNQSSRMRKLASISLLAFGLFAVAPISLVAQKVSPPRTESKKKTVDATEDAVNKKKNGSSKSTVRSDEKVVEASSARTQPGNISVTVNDGDLTTSMQVKKLKNGKLEVVYTKDIAGEKKIQKYILTGIDQLAKKNKEAFVFYGKHVESTQDGKGNEIQRRLKEMGLGSFGQLQQNPAGRNSSSEQSSDSSSQSSSSSAWESSSSVGRNGKTINNRKSGTTGNGMVGGGDPRLMIEQINKMIQQSDDPEMKAVLRQLLNQFRKN